MRLLRRLLVNWQNWIGLGIVGLFIVIAFAAPILSPPGGTNIFDQFLKRSTEPQERTSSPQPPSRDHPLGTLPEGWDIYHALIWGARSAIRLGLIVASGSAILGIIIGAMGGYVGGPFNQFVLWVTDSFIAFPMIAGVVLFRALLGVSGSPGSPTGSPSPIQWLFLTLSLDPVMIALILFSWTRYARLINVNIVRMKELPYIQASKALGASAGRVLLRHLIPNAISPAIVLIATDIGSAVILAATFTFVGLGGTSPWGEIIVMGRDWIIGPGGNPFIYWWTFVPASLALILFGIGWNLLGDGLNAAMEIRIARG
jgi:peptide/nickel transport system permease protein